jgi:hypothetical protein
MMIDDEDERKLYKIENNQDSSFQNFSSRIVIFLNLFLLKKNLFQNLVKRGVRSGAGGAGTLKPKEKNS